MKIHNTGKTLIILGILLLIIGIGAMVKVVIDINNATLITPDLNYSSTSPEPSRVYSAKKESMYPLIIYMLSGLCLMLGSKFRQTPKMEDFEYVFQETTNGKWVNPIIINGRTIEIRSYGIVMPKGRKLGFVVNGVVLAYTMTASKEFKRIIGSDTFDNEIEKINLYGNYMINKYRKKIFSKISAREMRG